MLCGAVLLLLLPQLSRYCCVVNSSEGNLRLSNDSIRLVFIFDMEPELVEEELLAKKEAICCCCCCCKCKGDAPPDC